MEGSRGKWREVGSGGEGESCNPVELSMKKKWKDRPGRNEKYVTMEKMDIMED